MRAIKYDGDGKRIGRTDDYVGEFVRLLMESIDESGVESVEVLVGEDAFEVGREAATEIVMTAMTLGCRVRSANVTGIHIVETL